MGSATAAAARREGPEGALPGLVRIWARNANHARWGTPVGLPGAVPDVVARLTEVAALNQPTLSAPPNQARDVPLSRYGHASPCRQPNRSSATVAAPRGFAPDAQEPASRPIDRPSRPEATLR